MNVIFDAADGKGFRAVVAGDAASVGPETELEIVVDCWAAIFGAEDAVVEGTTVGVRHARAPQKANGDDNENVAPINCVPERRPTIAQRFNAGSRDATTDPKPQRGDWMLVDRVIADSGRRQRSKRWEMAMASIVPTGLWARTAFIPSVETLGYYRLALRATIWATSHH
jgi:hypothetical protein